MKHMAQYGIAAGIVLAASAAHADGEMQAYDIPAQALSKALEALSSQSGTAMFYAQPTVAGRTSVAVKGHYSVREALQKMLAGSDLVVAFATDGSVSIKPPSAQLNKAEPTVLDEMTVTSKPWDGAHYNVLNSTTANKTDTPIMETPLAIQVIPQQIIKDVGATRFDRAVQYVSGINLTPAAAGNFTNQNGGTQTNTAFKLRGFTVSEYYRDGMRVPSLVDPAPEVAGLEQIEVLKGPASTLYGRQEPGGIVNLVTKQPLSTSRYAFQQQFGSFDLYRTTIDAGGPLTRDDPKLAYRFNLAYENTGSYVERVRGERIFVNPVLRWDISPSTRATLELEYLGSTDKGGGGTTPLIGTPPSPALIPIERNFDNLGKGSDNDKKRLSFHWSHDFNDQWTLRHRFDVIDASNARNSQTQFFLNDPSTCNPADCPGTISLVPKLVDSTTTYFTGLNLAGKFHTFGLKHTLLLGGDFQEFRYSQKLASQFLGTSSVVQQLFQPSARVPVPENGPYDTFNRNGNDRYGLYLQDQIHLPYDVHVMGGFRWDRVASADNEIESPRPGESFTDKGTAQDAVTPRFGLLWRPLPELSVYGNYLENFGAQNAARAFDPRTPAGLLLPPESARQWEVGLKMELFRGRLTGSVAWFDLTKTNVAVPDPDPNHRFGSTTFAIPVGEANNHGLEIDLAGELVPGWKGILGYAYSEALITQDSAAGTDASGVVFKKGNAFPGVPKHGLSFWTTYAFQNAELRGLSVGAGVITKSGQQNDPGNLYKVPGYTTLNLMLAYEFKLGPSKLLAQFNIDNVTDEFYYTPNTLGGFVGFGTPRTFLGSLRLDY